MSDNIEAEKVRTPAQLAHDEELKRIAAEKRAAKADKEAGQPDRVSDEELAATLEKELSAQAKKPKKKTLDDMIKEYNDRYAELDDDEILEMQILVKKKKQLDEARKEIESFYAPTQRTTAEIEADKRYLSDKEVIKRQKRVPLFIPPNDNMPDRKIITVNGFSCSILRGETVMVPLAIAELYDMSMEQEAKNRKLFKSMEKTSEQRLADAAAGKRAE